MNYRKISYQSFLWKIGTTSFRTREFNRKTEWQLQLLDSFWSQPENSENNWEGNPSLQERYYDWLHQNLFTTGSEPNKAKAAREKSSGLVDLGLIDNNRHLTEAGRYLLHLSQNQDFFEKTQLGISKDAQLYLTQLLKLHSEVEQSPIRPLIIIIRLLTHFQYLTYEEFRYLAPLCISQNTTEIIITKIEELRNGITTIDKIIEMILLSRNNYQDGLSQFCGNEYSPELLLSVSMNRKSGGYDKDYIAFYEELHAVYVDHDPSRILPLAQALSKIPTATMWRQILFDTTSIAAIENAPELHLLPITADNETDFRKFFFTTMHVFKAKLTLKDYFDLNRRYLGMTNCFIFEDDKVRLDIVPNAFFSNSIDLLYQQAFQTSELLPSFTQLHEICAALTFDENRILEHINQNLNLSITSIEQAYDEVEQIRYKRFDQLIDSKFTNQTLIRLLSLFDNRSDNEIMALVTNNADVPTIFEYVLGIVWYKVSQRKGRILDYMKLSLDTNLLPISHAVGGEADIVYEYEACAHYPAHALLLEATLADSTNQRRMEMEPVSRHLGNHLLSTKNLNSYCIFVTSYLHINVIGDFMNRKHTIYCNPQNENDYIEGMKIIPISTADLREIISHNIHYNEIYNHFDLAYKAIEKHPKKWYDNFVKVENSNLIQPTDGILQ